MRGKRSKQYRKLMEQFSMTFGFREPYQILVDAEMIVDSCRFKMELAPALQRTVHGKAKPMITQCEIRKLYARKSEMGMDEAIEVARSYERRRCGHHPNEFPEPLSTMECLKAVVDSKSTGENKHRYVVASQNQQVRRMLRSIRGVPLIYIKRSVMILEPMSDKSAETRVREERGKFRSEIKTSLGKRKRMDKEADDGRDERESFKDNDAEDNAVDDELPTNDKSKSQNLSAKGAEKANKSRQRGPKGPNPLSVRKPKQTTVAATLADAGRRDTPMPKADSRPAADIAAKRKRRRKSKVTVEPERQEM
ncbi:hypothetical protein CDD81_3001 [Ophiocordyceps australis]|uniref:U three protein 23 n=1 Tax=Ophiocordyceps australis TaxID=1399860 RepID=A0A2C5YIV3_9HYPO|nr:hypothetical protein CDD81_3001 [Ophiocordyceps australis]